MSAMRLQRPRSITDDINGNGDVVLSFFVFQAEDGIRDLTVTGVQTCALPIFLIDRWQSAPVENDPCVCRKGTSEGTGMTSSAENLLLPLGAARLPTYNCVHCRRDRKSVV